MPTTTTIGVILLGHHRDLDPTEYNNGTPTAGAERAGELVGQTFGSADNPLARNINEVSLYDSNSDGLIPFDNMSNRSDRDDPVTHVGGTVEIDTGILYRGTVTYTDGTVAQNVLLRVVQDTLGNLGLVPPPHGATAQEIEALTTKPIQSIQITSVAQNDFTHLDTSRYQMDNAPAFICFRNGTMILTDRGNVAVEDLKVGDLVVTRDNGLQPLRWIGSKKMGSELLQMFPKLRPVRIRAGALGQNLPERDLYVSQQHRILISSKIAARMMGETEVLIAAKFLTDIDGIDIDDSAEDLEYFHLLFDQHEIILSEGAATESLFTGTEALRAVDPAARAEMIALFPELTDADHEFAAARPIGTGREGRKLAQRHAANGRELQGAGRG
ncbi:Hint domain-containing protein [Paracoccus sp. DMF-8]|uniref:Hint domain-containing protein n=1 Tax=Paracoccus sp. DMF-8 TaxID=3019445 RepID=UPI0023E759D4|nr:Hint domain-containing protein [Paracoccus sp. DMF-8]MDF3606763.1 Hint domain-containing protein [Paracoccus sp. DMF-8]